MEPSLHLFANPLSGYLAACAGLLLVGGAGLTLRRVGLWFGGHRTSGEVVELRERLRAERGEAAIYLPVVRFTDARGADQTFQSRTGGGKQRWAVGARVPVLYDPLNPSRAEIAGPVHFWTAPVGLLGFGLIALIAAWRAAG